MSLFLNSVNLKYSLKKFYIHCEREFSNNYERIFGIYFTHLLDNSQSYHAVKYFEILNQLINSIQGYTAEIDKNSFNIDKNLEIIDNFSKIILNDQQTIIQEYGNKLNQLILFIDFLQKNDDTIKFHFYDVKSIMNNFLSLLIDEKLIKSDNLKKQFDECISEMKIKISRSTKYHSSTFF